MLIRRRLPLAAAGLLLSLAACTSQPTGSAQFLASAQRALSVSDVSRVKLTISSSDMTPLAVELARSNGSWGGLIGNIPAGANRTFLAEAFDSSGTRRFQGEASGITITANQTTAAAITLQELAPPPPYANEAPVIDSVVASTTSVPAGSSLSLTATVHDPNTADTLTLSWTASGGTFSAPTAATTSWTAPSSTGIQTLTFTVTDSQGAAASVSLAVNVVSGVATGNAAVNISFNLGPVVSRVSASLNRLDAGQSTAVSANASDADGDALSYQWASSCPGTWTQATSSAASFVPSAIPAGVCNNCQLSVTVQDGRGGQTTGTLNLCITSSSTERFAPRFTNFYQSATSTSPGQTVAFDVTALDPQSSALTFAWTATTGSMATAQNTVSTSRVVWTAPSCVSASTTPSITATVTNAFNLTVSQSFAVTGLPVCVPTWTSTPPLAAARYSHTATLLKDGRVLVSGGQNLAGSALALAEVYDPTSGTWSAISPMVVNRTLFTATLLDNGKVLVSGGWRSSTYLTTAEVYDPTSGTWSATAPMASARRQHTATRLNNGKVLVSGGVNDSGGLAAVEVYDPASGTWSVAASMASARYQHTATLLPNGKVLVSGGLSASGSHLATAEVYDPASNTWSATAPMASSREDHAAALLPDGKVLVSGGFNGSPLAAAEVYNPASNTWSAAAPMASARYRHTATLLPNGKLLVAGGLNTGVVALAEVYDPTSGTYSATAPMASARQLHTATLLNNGKVLTSAGITNVPLAAAELYTP
ncbi:Kelch repeat-containing protein [Pyxidicoccus caerfyrddinensis]|uniref:Kelch repeat-containing protein n=1 Tax=Pyxidicoccus caerfyrddinensis TaxID=2709663 RepID=UPI0013DB43E1|nr:kelch repeat-containing protein [Pyxidicoccus caerfyrddinensis]